MRVGVLGGGQLARMLALAGYPMGLRFVFYDPAPDAPAGQVGEIRTAAYDDRRALECFARDVDVATYEFENVPVAAARTVGLRVPIFPSPDALQTAQDRLAEKALFERLQIPTAPFARVDSERDLAAAVEQIGVPAVLKTRRLGYDGKGQWVLRAPGDAMAAWNALGGSACILERFVAFDSEASVLAVRGHDGTTGFYPLVENRHRDGILRLSRAPASPRVEALQSDAEATAARVLAAFDYVGVLAVEFFVDHGRLVANEIAPRVHNSGHWTIDGAEVSQFENHLRAGLGWPLGPTAPLGWSVMVNLIGVAPDPGALLAVPGAHLHLYGKTPRPGRKLGHLTLRAENPRTLDARLARLAPLLDPAVEPLPG
jgi:5-(carboxyamino)imidazole ribonucleotide synthase